MNRRTALGAFVVTTVTSACGILKLQPAAADAKPMRHSPDISGGLRLSTNQGDIGELELAKLHNAGKKVKVFLDGVEQKLCETADEGRGYVVRFVQSEAGDIMATDNNDILREVRYGHVRIEIV